jgi:hypothetical protein
MSEMTFEPFERALRARWYGQPARLAAEVRARWGDHPWPRIIRYRVLCRPGRDGRDHMVSYVGPTLAGARSYAASLRALGVGRPGAMEYYQLQLVRSKLGPSNVLIKTRIPVLMHNYEPPDVARMIGLFYRPSGRVTAHYEHGQVHRFASLRDCLAFYHRDADWLARREAFHLRAG